VAHVACIFDAIEAEAVTGATRAVKDLRCASINVAYLNRFASSLSALFAPAEMVDAPVPASHHPFVISISSDGRGQAVLFAMS
jgi:hypothetical protein